MSGVYDETTPPERFTDSGFTTVPWTAELALRVVKPEPDASREQVLADIRDAIDDDRLPPGAVDALITAGWVELDDAPAE